MIEGLRRAGNKAADNDCNTLGHFILLQFLMQISEYWHGLHLRRNGIAVRIDRIVIMRDTELAVGADQRLIQHLLFFVGHIRNQQ